MWLVADAGLDTYRRYCRADPAHRAENTGFVKLCVEKKRFLDAYVPDAMPMRGRVPGRCVCASVFVLGLRLNGLLGRRNDFNEEEKELLCQWLAMKIPENAAGGRLGNNVWQMLVDEATLVRPLLLSPPAPLMHGVVSQRPLGSRPQPSLVVLA